jgi:class 3 adenylate cyclase
MNVASRLVSQAKAGQIIISEYTFMQVRDRIEAIPLPAVTVKGKAEPLRIYQVLGLRGGQDWVSEPTNA